MLSFFNIWSVAAYEAKTLLRSWFFRIFAGLTILIIGAFDVIFFSGVAPDVPWFFRAIPSFIPFMNISWLNLIQAILAVFLSTEFLKRDKKMDTTEVIYMRSMTNGDYLFGKLFGIMMVFIGLNLALLFVAGIINGVFSDRPMNLYAYMVYPLLISIPTLVFTFGLAFMLMIIVRNQAVVFVLLLGYAAGMLFFVRDRFHGLFDYLSFYQPMVVSDFVGITSLDLLLMQRGLYLMLGFALIFASVLLLPRLPQSPGLRKIAGMVIGLMLAASLLIVVKYNSRFSTGMILRKQMNTLNEKLASASHLTLLSGHLNVTHNGRTIQVEDRIVYTNQNSEPMTKAIFSLNPGLVVDQVMRQGQSQSFTREAHILTIPFSQPLAAAATDSVEIRYHGAPNQEACYSYMDEEARSRRQRLWSFTSDKKFCFLAEEYVLLTPESMWYPVSGVPYGAAFPAGAKRDFVQYTMQVKTRPGLQVISQGWSEEPDRGRFIFKPETRLCQLSLVIGHYSIKSLQVDKVSYNLYYRPGHDYFTPYFKNLKDTLSVVVRDIKQDYERRLGLTYPYKRLHVIETPVQVTAYERLWTVQQENVLPEMILLPEYGLGVNGAEFPERSRRMETMAKRMNQVYTPQEHQVRLFRNFVESAFLGNRPDRQIRENWVTFPSNSSIFPLYYSTDNYFYSDQYPLFNVACESYLYNRSFDQAARQSPFRMFTGISDEEKANQKLLKNNLTEILQDKEKRVNAADVLRVKGEFLFKNIESHIGSDLFPRFITAFLTTRRFQQTPVNDLVNAIKEQYHYDLAADYSYWQESKKLPGFLVSDLQAYKVLDNDRLRYQVRFKIANPEPVSGLISVNFRRGGPGMGGMGGGRGFSGNRGAVEPDRLYRIAAGEVKEIGVVLDEAPQMLAINTLISKNMPLTISYPLGEMKEREKAIPFSGEQPCSLAKSSDEIIIDNEDKGFSFDSQASVSLIKKWMPNKGNPDDGKYKPLSWWSSPQTWTFTTLSDFYGHYIHSAAYIKSGKGDKTASWTAQIPANGQYDVFFHVGRMPGFFRERGGGSGRQMVATFHLKVHHDDGAEEVTLDMQKAEPGWKYLCTHYFSTGDAQVTISNESDGRIVYADAVKWVKK